MNSQFQAAGAAVHRPFHLPVPSSDHTADAGYNHPLHLPIPFSVPAVGNSLHSHLPVLSSDIATGNSLPSSDTAAGYFASQASRVGLTSDAAVAPPSSREVQKARIRAKILAEEASQARILEEEVRRELEYERGMTKRLSEVQSLGLLPPPIIPAQYLQPSQNAPAQHLLQPLLSQHLPRPTVPAQHLFLPPLSQHLPQPTDSSQHLMRNAPVHHVQAPNNLWSGDEPSPSFIPHHLESRFLPHNPDLQSRLDSPPDYHLPPRYSSDGLTGWPSYRQTAHHVAEIAVSFPSHSDFNGKRKHNHIATSGPICYECGEEGYLSRACNATIESRAAYKKGKAAMAAKRDVTPEIHHNKLADMENPWVNPNQTCYLCGNTGHWSRVCTASMEVRAAYKKNRTEPPRKRMKCKQCGKKDHLPNACNASMEARDAYKKHKRAYKKHKRMKARGEAAQADASKIKEQECCKCGGMGHWSRTCKATREVRAVYIKKVDEISQAAAENQV